MRERERERERERVREREITVTAQYNLTKDDKSGQSNTTPND